MARRGQETERDDEGGDWEAAGSLRGQFLIAMPTMPDPRFQKTVIYLCEHGPDGAMGLVVNRLFKDQHSKEVSFGDLLEQLEIDGDLSTMRQPVHFGGPVENARGFVLHTTDLTQDGTLVIDDDVALTATLDMLHAMAKGAGPRHAILALGYAGWAPGQLDQEIQANGWLTAPADRAILFDTENETKWDRAVAKIGIDPSMLSATAGHA